MNHDPRLIEAVLAGADGYEAAGSQHQASDGFGWYTEDTRAGTAYREVPVTGLIIAPMVDLLLAARNDPKIAVLIESRRGKLLDLISRSIAGLDKSYVQPGANGYYLLPSGADVEPLNLMSVYARPLLGYWQLTGDAESLREVTGIARTWKSALSIRLDGTVSWPHTARPTGNTGPAEFLIKSSAAIEFPLAAFEAGLVLDKKDILALSHAPMTTLWTANEHGRIQVRETVDAASQSFLSATGADRSTALRPAAWYAYLCYDHTLKSALDAYLFSIDPRFTEHGEFAMFALANRLANEPVEGTCEIPNVPELQTASAR